VLVVHLYGQLRDPESWAAFCRDHQLQLIEDCAQAHGAADSGRRAGTFGAVGVFSFYPTKNLGAKGDAGALITNSDEARSRLRTLRNCGMRDRYEHIEAGLNSRLDELQAAILRARLDWLERFNKRRQEIARRYLAEIKNSQVELLTPPVAPDNHVYHLFVVRSRERDRLADYLKMHGVQTLIHYPIPAHLQHCCRHIRFDSSGLPNAELHARQCLSIPCQPQMTDDQASLVIETVNKFQ
jgi:dTDP-4-amino-4,6-dideoxygalactose transaminase